LDHLIFATGRKPALSFCSQELLTHQEELLNSHRLFFVGDVINDRYRQVAIAVGDGIRTALEIDSHGSL
jgi:thioredoxin reductase